MSKGAKNQTVTQKLDPATEAMQRDVYYATRNAANSSRNLPGPVGPNWATQEALSGFRDFGGMGQIGARGLMGDAGIIQNMTNPYQQQVVDAANADFGNTLGMIQRQVGDAATQFGGGSGLNNSRSSLALGQAFADAGRGHNMQLAQLRSQGYGDAMSRAGSLATMGMGALGQQASLGDYMRNVENQQLQFSPDQRYADILKSGMTGVPYGSSTTQPVNRNIAGSAAGGASIGAAFGPWGALGGAALGGLLGAWG